MAQENRLKRDTPFLAHIRFRNDLPEIPSDPKLLVNQIQPEVLSRFTLTALERQARRDLLTPPSIIVSPLDAQRYVVPDNPGPMHPADAALLKDEGRPVAVGGGSAAGGAADGRHKSFAARSKGMDVDKCSWLMRTTYISSSDNRATAASKQGLPEKQVGSQHAPLCACSCTLTALSR
jgi:RNA polymerase II-associated factor 1